ncbi:MAG: tail fiber domain-containing protein [Acidobacteriaceae bacterium]|nr:tail fiber domain-containing protein [Acidobacteriaceae bacterium]
MLFRRSPYHLLAISLVLTPLPALKAQAPASFVPVVPCRVVDTRAATGPFGGPSMTAVSTRSFPIPTSACGIPANASAYIFNLAVVPWGPLNYVTIWPTGQTQPLVSSMNDQTGLILSNAVIVQAGQNGAISAYVTDATDIILDIDGYFLPQSDSATEGTALGTGANDAGMQNTAVGFETLQVNGSGNGNTAAGSLALAGNTSGNNNVAVGAAALSLNATGSANTAVGGQALFNDLLGSGNTGIGFGALWSDTTGANNTAVGVNALSNSGTASGNIALGYGAGSQVTIGTDNIEIGNAGAAADSNVMRIGTSGSQTSTFVAGINNATVSGSAVLVDPNTGQLGIATSSALYKEDIRDMGDTSEALMRLRPVTFRYKHVAGSEGNALHYGLIAEEVEKVYPDLVVHGPDGRVESVQYHQLPAMLLNEAQQEHRTIEQQQNQIRALEERIGILEGLLREQMADQTAQTK